MKLKEIYVLGVGGHSRVISDTLNVLGYKILGYYDDNPHTHGYDFQGALVIGEINTDVCGLFVIAIGNNKIRYLISTKLNSAIWETIIHPSTIISKNVEIGIGTVIMAGAIIQSGARIGKHSIINTGACIDHDSFIDDFVHIGPNCSIAGGVHVECGAFIGIGSVIMPNVKIGKWCIVGAGSVVIKDIPDYAVAVGNPSKVIKFLKTDE